MGAIVTFFVFLALGLIILFITRRQMQARGALSHALGLALLRIRLPRVIAKDGEKSGMAETRERIALMEQVFAQLASVREGSFHTWFYGKPFFSFEIAVPQVGQEVIFYCAVPRKYVSSVEKVIQGVYAESEVIRANDYTIFHEGGAVKSAVIKGNSKYLPLKTYQTLETDPLGPILNGLSKIAQENEGIVLQIVAQKADRDWNKKLITLAKNLKQGKSLSQSLHDTNKSKFVKTFKQSLTEKGSKEKQKEPESRGPVNENLAQAVEKKSQKPLFSVNIRIVASATNEARASSLLQELTTPFTQYTSEETNALTVKEDSVGRATQKTVYQYSFRVPDWQNSTILSSEELTSIIHLPNTTTASTSNVAALKTKVAQAPFNISKTGTLLGVNDYRGTTNEIRITTEDRLRHFYIIGQTGTGKSYLMRNMIIQDIEAGNGVCFIDPHGDMAEELLKYIPPQRVADVIYFNPGDIQRPMGINMLEFDPNYPEQKTFIINELLEIFNKLYDMKTAGGPMFEQYFRNATALVMDDPDSGNTLLEINRVFVDKKFRDYKLSKTTNPLVRTFWKEVAEKAGGEASLQNIVPYISSKFDSFLSNEIMRPIVAQERSAFRLRDVMDSSKILLINLSKGRLGELNSSLVGLIMVGKILMSAFSRVDIPETQRKNFYLYIDEFQNVTTNSIETILSEARKYRLAMTVAHQFIGQLSDEIKKSVFGNVGSMSAFRVGSEDGEFLEKQFTPQFNANDLVNLDNRSCVVKLLIGGQTAPAFSMQTLPGKPGNPEMAEKAKEFSRLTYGRDRADVENEIRQKFEATQAAKNPPPVQPL